jgi:hypothetical protein
MADIDLSSVANWEPLPDFKGSMQGNNFTINNLKIDRGSTDYIGLVSIVSGTGEIRDIKLRNINIKGALSTGGLVGLFESTGTIKNCSVTGTVQGTGTYNAGGLAGAFKNGTMEDCYAVATVSGNKQVGGLVGTWQSGLARKNYANCTVQGVENVGGFVGAAVNQGTTNFQECYSTGNVSSTVFGTGGFAGILWKEPAFDIQTNPLIISNCYSTANATGVGGVGGFIGNMCGGTVANSYATGTIQTQEIGGGFVGRLSSEVANTVINISKCYALGNISSSKKNAYGDASLRRICWFNYLFIYTC